jgi:CDP-glucose 4,6-dehydratase
MANKPGEMENLVNLLFLTSAYCNKRVFITGHTGFKGAWLAAILQKCGAIVRGYALSPESEKNLFSLTWKEGEGESIIADIRDRERIVKEIVSFQPDIIFHLAAQPLVRRSYQIPAETFDVNAIGTANLLEAVKALTKKCVVIIVTTDKVYKNKEQDILYKEEDELGGYDPYSASKACAELVVSSFRSSFFHPDDYEKHKKSVVSARAGNVIGGGDWSADRLVPDIMRSLSENKPVAVRNPNSVRPWQHVLEPLSGYLLLAALLYNQPQDYSGAYNFGPMADDHLTVEELVKLAIQSWGSGNWEDASATDQPHEAKLLKLDISKAIKELGWQPKLDSRRSVEWTVKWYKQTTEKAAAFTIQQIEEYFSL